MSKFCIFEIFLPFCSGIKNNEIKEVPRLQHFLHKLISIVVLSLNFYSVISVQTVASDSTLKWLFKINPGMK